MAVLYNEHSPKKLADGEGGSYTAEGGDTWKTTWQVITDDPNTPIDQIILATGIPRLGDILIDPYSGFQDGRLQCVRKDPQRWATDKSHKIWRITCSYEVPNSSGGGQGQQGQEPNPLKWHDEIEIDTNQFSKPTEDAEYHGGFIGKFGGSYTVGNRYPVVNSLGIRGDTALEKDVSNTVLRITKFLPEYPAVDEDLVDKVNFDEFIIDKYQFYKYIKRVKGYEAKLQALTGSFNFQNNIAYWRVTYVLEFGNWFVNVLDEGVHEVMMEAGDRRPDETIIPGGSLHAPYGGSPETHFKRKMITDEFGIPVTKMVPLDGGGKVLRDAEVAAGRFVYIKWCPYESSYFGTLNL